MCPGMMTLAAKPIEAVKALFLILNRRSLILWINMTPMRAKEDYESIPILADSTAVRNLEIEDLRRRSESSSL